MIVNGGGMTGCSTRYTAAHSSGSRPRSAIRWVVVHSTEGDTAKGAATWFQNPLSGGSTQLVVDDHECYRTLPDLRVPWAAPGANTGGLHVEHAGYAAWTREKWLTHDLMLRRSARLVAAWCDEYSIPARWVGPLGLKLRRKGLTTHADCTKAFGGDHTDPGAGFPKDVYLRHVKAYSQVNDKRLAALRKWILARVAEGRSWAWVKKTHNWAEFKRRGGK